MRRQLQVIAINLAVLCVLLELGGVIWHGVRYREFYYVRKAPSRDAAKQELSGDKPILLSWRLHPFLGYIESPRRPLAQQWNQRVLKESGVDGSLAVLQKDERNNFGFITPGGRPYPLLKTSPKQYYIGIFGGSVASNFHVLGADYLVKRLKERVPQLRDREPVILDFAASGYKQPQQLQALTYFLSIGQPLDMVINLDGANDSATSMHGFKQYGYLPWMPSFGLAAVVDTIDQGTMTPERIEALYALSKARKSVDTFDRLKDTAPLAILSTIAEVAGTRARIQLGQAEAHYAQLQRKKTPDPLVVINKTSEMAYPEGYDPTSDIIEFWARSSRLMQEVSISRGITYVHVLQPNQQFSRHPFSSEERAIAFGDFYVSGELKKAYPLLVERGRKLKLEGVNFFDGTTAFDHESRAVFSDACCHYNRVGNERMADFLTDAVAKTLALKH